MSVKLIQRMFHWKKLDIIHVCDLMKNSESHLLRLPPNAKFIARFKRRLQKFILISENHPFTRLYLRSKATIAFEKHRHGISPNWWVIHPYSSFRHYVGRLFIVDLISSIPYTWFYKKHLENPGLDVQLHLVLLEMLPLLKIFRLCTLRHYIKEIVLACGASRVYEHGVWIFWLTLLIFHWAACFTYAFPFLYAYIMKTSLDKAEGYLFKTKLYEKSDWIIYLTSLHMGGGNLCSYSFTEFNFTELPDKVTRCILLLFGMAYFFYVIVIILQLVSSSAEPELKYQSIICGVKDYIKNKKLTKKLRERLLHFYEHRFQGSLFKERAITSTLSKHLKYEITQHSSSILLKATPLFNNIPRSLLSSIIGALKQVIFLQDDIIYKCDVEGKCMYFIVTGTVAVISYSGKEICHINDGDYFGETALIQHEHKRKTSAIALEVCEVLRFDRRDFIRLVSSKSEIYKRFESVAHKRIQDFENFENEKCVLANVDNNL